MGNTLMCVNTNIYIYIFMLLKGSDKSDSPRWRAASSHGFLKLLPSYITFVRHKTFTARRALPVICRPSRRVGLQPVRYSIHCCQCYHAVGQGGHIHSQKASQVECKYLCLRYPYRSTYIYIHVSPSAPLWGTRLLRRGLLRM